MDAHRNGRGADCIELVSDLAWWNTGRPQDQHERGAKLVGSLMMVKEGQKVWDHRSRDSNMACQNMRGWDNSGQAEPMSVSPTQSLRFQTYWLPGL
jgi:hypothetical protein